MASMGRLYIYLHECFIFMENVGKYTSPMDGKAREKVAQVDRQRFEERKDLTR